METQQRIIYSGRLLQDDVQLKDVLRQVGAVKCVFHDVCLSGRSSLLYHTVYALLHCFH